MDENSNQKADRRTNIQECKSYRERFIAFVTENDKFIIAMSTLCIAFFTLTLFFATWLLWWSGEQHAERQLRAYVLMESGDVKNVAINQNPIATIIVKNSGKTPAYDVQCTVGIDFREYPLTSNLNSPFDPSKPMEKSPIPPRGKAVFSLKHNELLTPVKIDQLNNATNAIYVIGEITYKDTFGKRRFTKFLVFHNKSTISDFSSLTPYKEGNESN